MKLIVQVATICTNRNESQKIISDIKTQVKKSTHMWFNLCNVQKQTKLIHVVRSYHSSVSHYEEASEGFWGLVQFFLICILTTVKYILSAWLFNWVVDLGFVHLDKSLLNNNNNKKTTIVPKYIN